ncbi:MAG: hypothetical protein Q8M65_00070, partial [Rhodoglobus sp.]|nr:hypothetical protein [Rhodoglobus sp.]
QRAEVVAEALAAIAPDHGAGGAASAAAQTLLAAVVKASMAQATRPQQALDEPTLYTLLPPVREFALEQCGADEPQRVRVALRRWLAAQLQERLPREERLLRHDWPLSTPLILSAAQDGAPATALALAVAARGLWNLQAPGPATVKALQRAAEREHDPVLASQSQSLLALISMHASDGEAAMAHAEAALAKAPDDLRRAMALTLLSNLWLFRGGEPARAEAWLDEALACAERSGDASALAQALRMQAVLAVNHREDLATAEPLMRRSLRLYESLGNLGQMRQCQLDLAACLGAGRERASVALLQACVGAWRAENEPVSLARGLAQLGRFQLRLAQPALAEANLRESLQYARATGQHGLVMLALLHLPEAWVLQGRAKPAALLQGYFHADWQRGIGT